MQGGVYSMTSKQWHQGLELVDGLHHSLLVLAKALKGFLVPLWLPFQDFLDNLELGQFLFQGHFHIMEGLEGSMKDFFKRHLNK